MCAQCAPAAKGGPAFSGKECETSDVASCNGRDIGGDAASASSYCRPCADRQAAGPGCVFLRNTTCHGRGRPLFNGTCAECEPDSAGRHCELTREATCNGRGRPLDSGACTACDTDSAGEHCELTRDSTCHGNGRPLDSGACACDTGFDATTTCQSCTARVGGGTACDVCEPQHLNSTYPACNVAACNADRTASQDGDTGECYCTVGWSGGRCECFVGLGAGSTAGCRQCADDAEITYTLVGQSDGAGGGGMECRVTVTTTATTTTTTTTTTSATSTTTTTTTVTTTTTTTTTTSTTTITTTTSTTTATTTTATTTTSTTTTQIKDCAFAFSVCSSACETGAQRAINITRQPQNGGKACPKQGDVPNCKPLDGGCPTTTTTTTTTTTPVCNGSPDPASCDDAQRCNTRGVNADGFGPDAGNSSDVAYGALCPAQCGTCTTSTITTTTKTTVTATSTTTTTMTTTTATTTTTTTTVCSGRGTAIDGGLGCACTTGHNGPRCEHSDITCNGKGNVNMQGNCVCCEGYSSDDNCRLCSDAYTFAEGTDGCVPRTGVKQCPGGEFSDQDNVEDVGKCTSCPVNTYASETADKSSYRVGCTQCPPNTKSRTKSTSIDQCMYKYKVVATSTTREAGYCTGEDLVGVGNNSEPLASRTGNRYVGTPFLQPTT